MNIVNSNNSIGAIAIQNGNKALLTASTTASGASKNEAYNNNSDSGPFMSSKELLATRGSLPTNSNGSKCRKVSFTTSRVEDILHQQSQYLSTQKVVNNTNNNNNNADFCNLTQNTTLAYSQLNYSPQHSNLHQQSTLATSTLLLACQNQNSESNSVISNNTNNSSSRNWSFQQKQVYNQLTACDTNTYDTTITSSMTAAAAAAAAAAVSKFEQTSNDSTMAASNGFSMASWPSATADWDLSAAGRSGLDSRMINSSPYYNSSNYAAVTNAAYLASYPQNYLRGSTAAAAVAAAATTPFNYLAATTCNSINYGYNGNNCGTHFGDYYNLNYYGINGNSGNSAAAVMMLGASPSALSGDILSSRSSSSTNNKAATTSDDYKSSQLSHNNNDENQCNILLQDIVSGPTTALSNLPLHNISPCGDNAMPLKIEKPKRTKKKKACHNTTGNSSGISLSIGTNRTTPEPNNTRVFVWELEDLCILAANQYRSIDPFMVHVIDQIVQCAFHIAHGDELNQANVEDAEVDESLQHQEFYLNSSGLQNSLINHTATPLESSASVNCNRSMDFLSTYSTIDPSTSSASNTNTAAVAVAAAAAAATVVNNEMLEGLKRIADKYKHIRATYDAYKENLSEFLNISGLSAQKEDILARLRDYDKHTNCQTERYRRCLRIIMERSHLIEDKCTNIVLTHEPLPSAFAKLLSFDLARFVPIKNVYSISKLGREAGLAHVTERFRKQHAVIISSSLEFRALARQENIPFWMINNLRDVDALYFALDTILLVDTTANLAANTTPNNQNATSTIISSTSISIAAASPLTTNSQQNAYV